MNDENSKEPETEEVNERGFVSINLDIDDKTVIPLLRSYVIENLEPASADIFEEVVEKESSSIRDIFTATGEAVFNDIVLECILRYIEESDSLPVPPKKEEQDEE